MRTMRSRMTEDGIPGRIISQGYLDDLEFPHRVDLWKPSDLAVTTGNAAEDVAWELAVSNQPCRFVATPEIDMPELVGRTKVVNIFTLDHFLFPVGLAIEDQWWIKSLFATGDYVGRWWVVEGNPQGQEYNPFHVVRVQHVYAKLGTPPAGVS